MLSALIALSAALYLLGHLGFRDGLQAVLKNFDIARKQYQRQAGFAPIERQRLGTAGALNNPGYTFGSTIKVHFLGV